MIGRCFDIEIPKAREPTHLMQINESTQKLAIEIALSVCTYNRFAVSWSESPRSQAEYIRDLITLPMLHGLIQK